MIGYDRINKYTSDYCNTCREYKAECPDCESPICVTCQDSCPTCGLDLWEAGVDKHTDTR